MKWIVALLAAFVLTGSVSAEGCNSSREYILEGLAGDLEKPAARYQDLFKICVETLTLANVKDAYVLKDGGIANSSHAQHHGRDGRNACSVLPTFSKKRCAIPHAPGTKEVSHGRAYRHDIFDGRDTVQENPRHDVSRVLVLMVSRKSPAPSTRNSCYRNVKIFKVTGQCS